MLSGFKQVKQHKVKSDSPEPVGMGDEPDTQVRVHHSDDDVDFNDDECSTHKLLVIINLVKAPI